MFIKVIGFCVICVQPRGEIYRGVLPTGGRFKPRAEFYMGKFYPGRGVRSGVGWGGGRSYRGKFYQK